jgi:quercetin dioxygenase-like cupin family protein
MRLSVISRLEGEPARPWWARRPLQDPRRPDVAIVEHPMEPHVIVEPHVHSDENELSYVVAGTTWVRVGKREVKALPGSYVWKPRGVMHSFWNPGPDPARVLEVLVDEIGPSLRWAEANVQRVAGQRSQETVPEEAPM